APEVNGDLDAAVLRQDRRDDLAGIALVVGSEIAFYHQRVLLAHIGEDRVVPARLRLAVDRPGADEAPFRRGLDRVLRRRAARGRREQDAARNKPDRRPYHRRIPPDRRSLSRSFDRPPAPAAFAAAQLPRYDSGNLQ